MAQTPRFLRKTLNRSQSLKDAAVKIYLRVQKARYDFYARYLRINPRIIVFESYLGQSYSCSPRAIFEALCREEWGKGYTKVWMFENPEKYKYLEELYPGTRVVRYHSRKYFRYYARAKYWVTNYILSHGIYRREGQVYIQTWHGTPLKKIGCDVPRRGLPPSERRFTFKRYIREGRQISYLLSPSDFYSEVVKNAFRLSPRARIIQFGYPRNDALFTADEAYVRAVREKLSLPEGKKVILYAPTWRHSQHDESAGLVCDLGLSFDALKAGIGDEAVILFRTHYLIRNSLDLAAYKGFVFDVSDYDEVNDLYLVSDMLITDYSSVFFDYANLQRPMLFYMYDYEAYRDEMNDFYFDISLLPGPVIKEKKEDISEDIKALFRDFQVDEAYVAFNKKFNPYRRPCAGSVVREIWGRGREKDGIH